MPEPTDQDKQPRPERRPRGTLTIFLILGLGATAEPIWLPPVASSQQRNVTTSPSA